MDAYIYKCEYTHPFITHIKQLNLVHKDKVNIENIKKGLFFAILYHNEQFRKTGEPYICHPISVATMVASYNFIEDAIIAALLHDTVEDTELTIDNIRSEFNPRVAQMVGMLTKYQNNKKLTSREIMLHCKKYQDEDTAIIKLCDRLDNLSTIEVFRKEKIDRIIDESIELFCYWGLEFNAPRLAKMGYKVCIDIRNKLDNTNIDNNYNVVFLDRVRDILYSNF